MGVGLGALHQCLERRSHGAFTMADLLEGLSRSLGPAIAAGHDEDGVGAGLGIRAEDALDYSVSEYL